MHKCQNSLDDNLCKSDVQVDIYLKLLMIKSNPVVFLLIPMVLLVCNFKFAVEEIFVSCYLFIIMSSLKGHSYLKVVSDTCLLVCFLSLKESTCQTRKNVSYFTSKALFVLEITKF